MKSEYKALQRTARKTKRQADREDRRMRQQVRKLASRRAHSNKSAHFPVPTWPGGSK